MIDRLFLAHPRSVDESYTQHFSVAARVGATMVVVGMAVLVHAVVPGLFVRTGRRTILRLYEEIGGRGDTPPGA
ncbi:DUF6356 family protein [Sphingomonas profundi]|uniref:DUF6356 family protein n=1 Tax=Alterirhizorhabdus profundi TaxID=2681549 RepID=UPI0012E7ACFC|nr:DUF6356 family protein [Sphingomonas profundi]